MVCDGLRFKRSKDRSNTYHARYSGHYTWTHHQVIRDLNNDNIDIYETQKHKFHDYIFYHPKYWK